MLSVTLSINRSDNTNVNKKLLNSINFPITIKDASSIINPSITIKTDANITKYNYAEIPAFGRYYYINEIKSLRNGLWEISLKVDVLMSFKDEFLNLTAVIDRQQNKYNLYLDDGAFRVLQKDRVQTKSFSKGFTNGNYLLTVAG